MAVTIKTLFSARYLTNTNQNLYVSPDGTTGVVTAIVANNQSASEATVTFHIVLSGETAQDSNQIVSAKRIPPGESYGLPEIRGQAIQDGAILVGVCSENSAVVVRASGVEIT